jgi:hypothetical protein
MEMQFEIENGAITVICSIFAKISNPISLFEDFFHFVKVLLSETIPQIGYIED